ncbi:hypothetical protein DM02DRAFT_538359 [Periconia macrospinosa]|uniref:Uncharacterized protein n=1 Tax=Periconia macrospinosa TaxID=97972 RepID=A0A2V1DCL7_9PLEO|nr:hypothetical protein DM02DRAFT_538359 [Periconia macrospinosa]
MLSVLVHVCSTCSCSSTVPWSPFVFSQNNACPYCGAISKGINIEDSCKPGGEEANMQQEELSRMFSAHMSLSQAPQQQQQLSQPESEQQQQQQVPQEQPPPYGEIEQVSQPITYISQHYTHSYHVAPVRHTASAPPSTQAEPSELEAMLLRNSIDPALLFPSQIDLFKNADNDQRLRLLELWRISPPQGRQGYPSGLDYNTSRQLYDWPPTSLAQEEAMAKLRYESLMEDKAQQEAIQNHQQELDESMDTESGASAEPYIVSGYDMLAAREYEQSAKTSYNQATDPVYVHPGSNGGLWEKNVGSIYDMENQYGAFAHARDHEVRPIYVDDEMMM